MKNQFTTTANFFKKVSETVFLFKKQWKENTIALFRSHRESDKTPFITELIESVAVDDRKVLYVNTEHRADAFVERFVNNENLLIFTPAYDSPDDSRDYADLVISGIEEAVAETDIRTFIIDSVTRIAALSFGRNASAAYVMKRLAALQARHGISLLVIAHSSTKSTDRALTALCDTDLSDPQESNKESVTKCNKKCRDATCSVLTNKNPVNLALSENSEISELSAHSETEKSLRPSTNSINMPPILVDYTQVAPPMNRHERRALERQNRKRHNNKVQA